MAKVDSFPWSELPDAVALEGDLIAASEAFRASFDPTRIAALCSDLLGADWEDSAITSRSVTRSPTLTPWSASVATSQVIAIATPEPDLVSFLLTRLLDRDVRPGDPGAGLLPALRGAWHGLFLEVARRLARGEAPSLVAIPEALPGPACVHEGWLRLDGRSFGIQVVIVPKGKVSREATRDVPLTLPLVTGTAWLSRAEIASLRRGDVLLPGAGWFGEDSVIAVAPDGEHGFRLQLSENVRYLEPTTLAHELPAEGAIMDDATRESAIAEAPVIVRVEVATITLSAKEWMELRPGDVLGCGVPPRSPVTLRAAGAEFARGELVTVDGELGVRVTQLVGSQLDPTSPSANTPPEVR